MAIYFEWDPEKARKNLRDHGVSFEVASRVFYDDFRVTDEDIVFEGEQRWQTIGMVDGTAILLVAHLEDAWGTDVYVRMISARHVTPIEGSVYEQNRSLHNG